jgi:ubiquinone/menaquinone biosynthesis C-methylase UbiE
LVDKEKFYNNIAAEFDSIMNMYDTLRRVEVIFKDFLGKEDLTKKVLLDAGCGTGIFTKEALSRGASVTSLDIAENLVQITKTKNPKTNAIVGSLLQLPFEDNSFDIVVCSDVIEHTIDPFKATEELIRVLKPNGLLCLTVPNRSFWYFSVLLANSLKIRKYSGYENWVHYSVYRKYLIQRNLDIIDYKGIHLFPFVINWLNPVLKRLDKVFEKKLGRFMVNIAVVAKKPIYKL